MATEVHAPTTTGRRPKPANRSQGNAASRKRVFDAVKPIAQGIVETFGPMCEVVVHDYHNPSRSVIYVVGDVTHRHVGQPASPIGLRMIAQGNDAQDEYNYITRTANGRVLKSTTVLLRDGQDVIGALCINFDITEVRQLVHGLSQIGGEEIVRSPEDVPFTADIRDLIGDIINEEELRLAMSVERMTREERLRLLNVLDSKGVFALRGSVAEVARRIGVSRATAYNYLSDLRTSNGSGAG